MDNVRHERRRLHARCDAFGRLPPPAADHVTCLSVLLVEAIKTCPSGIRLYSRRLKRKHANECPSSSHDWSCFFCHFTQFKLAARLQVTPLTVRLHCMYRSVVVRTTQNRNVRHETLLVYVAEGQRLSAVSNGAGSTHLIPAVQGRQLWVIHTCISLTACLLALITSFSRACIGVHTSLSLSLYLYAQVRPYECVVQLETVETGADRGRYPVHETPFSCVSTDAFRLPICCCRRQSAFNRQISRHRSLGVAKLVKCAPRLREMLQFLNVFRFAVFALNAVVAFECVSCSIGCGNWRHQVYMMMLKSLAVNRIIIRSHSFDDYYIFAGMST
jgi:hypothetical protein